MTATFVCQPEERERWLEARRAGISASEIAIVLGISPYDSPFNLYWSKRLGWEGDVNDLMSTGTWLEPTIADWWATENPSVAVCPAGLYAHKERPWQLASPDRLVRSNLCACAATDDVLCSCLPDDGPLLAVLECKWVAHSWDGWGPDGTDEIPVYYLTQVLWQCDVMGVDQWYVCALGPTGFRSYAGLVDPGDLERMRKAAQEFMSNDDPPPLDSHAATLGALKRLHPDLEDVAVEVDVNLADNYWNACAGLKMYDALKRRYEIQLRDAMGPARRATWPVGGPWSGEVLATRVISEVAQSTRTVAAHRRDYLLPPRTTNTKDTP